MSDHRSSFKKIRQLNPVKKDGTCHGFHHVQDFLCRFGYMRPKEYTKDVLDNATFEALKDYQRAHGRRAVGYLNKATLDEMTTPRCGMRDVQNRIALTEACKWDKSIITYAIDSNPSNISQSNITTAVGNAFRTWETEIPRMFRQVGQGDNPDILLGWRSPANHSDFSFNDGTVAHADFPGTCFEVTDQPPKPVHFNSAKKWSIGAKHLHFDVESVALHEIGHILGLEHSEKTGAIMFKRLRTNRRRVSLRDEDKTRVRALYEIDAIALSAATARDQSLEGKLLKKTLLRRLENIEREAAGLRDLIEKLET